MVDDDIMTIDEKSNIKSLIILTTSREPSPRTRSLVKDLSALSSNILRVNRGKMTYKELISRAFALGAKTLAIIGEMKGNPSIIRIYDVEPVWFQQTPIHMFTIFLSGVSLSRESRYRLPEKPLDSVYIVTNNFIDNTQRILSIALSRIFSATIVSSRIKGRGLKVYVVPRNNRFIVYFKLEEKRIGPVMYISEARIIGKPIIENQTRDND